MTALFSSEDDMDFLLYQKNSDSLELSSNNSETANSTPSKSFMSTSSWSPSIAFPDSFENMEPFPADELLSDLNLPSLGQGIHSKRLITQILNGVYGQDHEFIKQISLADQFATNRGQTALKALGSELSTTKEQNTELKLELNRLKEMVTQIKDELTNLDIPENVYISLSNMDPSELTIKEYACVRAAEIYLPLKRDLHITKKQLEEVHIALEMNTTSLQTQQEVLARTRKHAQSASETNRLDQRVAEEHILKLTARLETEIAKRRESEDKAERFDVTLSENLKLREELETIRNLMNDQSEALKTISASESHLKSLYDDIFRAKEMLQLDKTFLQKEVSELLSKNHQNERIVETQAVKITQLEGKLMELTDQLTRIQQTTRSQFDERMEREVQRLRDDYTKELDALKESSKEILDRENRVLREVKSNLQTEVDQLRRRVDEKDAELQRSYREMNSMSLTKDNEISTLRAELKMKSFEVNSLGATFEERMAQLKAANLELEVLREEVSAHRSAILRLESESDSKEIILRENLSRAYETIRAYELLLHDGSEGGRGSGDINVDELPTLPPSLPLNQTAWGSSLQSTPLPITVLSSDPRKLRQLLNTTEKNIQKISSLENKLNEQQKLIVEYEKQQTETSLKMDRANRCLSLMNQPNKYLLERLNEREVECHALEKRVRELEKEVDEGLKEKKRSELEIFQLKERLQLLLSQRNEINSLRSMLESLRSDEQQQLQDNDEEEEDDDDEEEDDDDDDDGEGDDQSPRSDLDNGSGNDNEEQGKGKGHSHPHVKTTPTQTNFHRPGHVTITPMRLPLQQEGYSLHGSSSSPAPPPPSPPPTFVVMEATRPVTAVDLGLSPAAMRSMLERTQATPSKKRITTGG